jgi:hypothetical protein
MIQISPDTVEVVDDISYLPEANTEFMTSCLNLALSSLLW